MYNFFNTKEKVLIDWDDRLYIQYITQNIKQEKPKRKNPRYSYINRNENQDIRYTRLG